MDNPGSKICTRCKADTPLTEFGVDNRLKSRKKSVCKPCCVEVARAWQLANPEAANRARRNWDAKQPPPQPKPRRERNPLNWAQRNPKAQYEAQKRWKAKNAEYVKIAASIYSKEQREKRKAKDLDAEKWRERIGTLKRVGMTVESYDKMFESQGMRCAICLRERSDDERPFAVDHDHTCCPPRTACIKCHRGLLCPGCNTALHKLETMDGWVQKALAYLNRFKGD